MVKESSISWLFTNIGGMWYNDAATLEAQKKDKILMLILIATSFISALIEMCTTFKVVAEGKEFSMSMGVPATALIPGIVIVVMSVIRIIKGEKIWEHLWLGLSMILIPYVIMGGTFLFYELFIY